MRYRAYTNVTDADGLIVEGLPALGKSTMVRRMCLGLAGFGVNPMIFGDLKPDYVPLIML